MMVFRNAIVINFTPQYPSPIKAKNTEGAFTKQTNHCIIFAHYLFFFLT